MSIAFLKMSTSVHASLSFPYCTGDTVHVVRTDLIISLLPSLRRCLYWVGLSVRPVARLLHQSSSFHHVHPTRAFIPTCDLQCRSSISTRRTVSHHQANRRPDLLYLRAPSLPPTTPPLPRGVTTAADDNQLMRRHRPPHPPVTPPISSATAPSLNPQPQKTF
jgi:hypothetical protein